MRVTIPSFAYKCLLLLLVNTISFHLISQSSCRDVEIIAVPNDGSERNINPSVSCDGQTIVWRGNDGQSNLIYRADCDGHVTLVSDQTVINTRPQISADGSTIVWAGYTVGDNFQLEEQNIYKSVNCGPQTLVSPVSQNGTSINNDTPQVCSDGSQIVWRGYLGDTEHVFMNDGSQTIQISTSSSSRNSTPRISDGCNVITWMGFDANTNRYQIFMYENGNVKNISSPNGSEKSYNQVLSADGEVIVWIGIDNNNNDQIYMYQDDQITQITSGMPGQHMYPSVSNDGTTISWSNFDNTTNKLGVYMYTPLWTILVDSYVMDSSNPIFLSSSVSESGNSIVWGDPYDNIMMYNLSADYSETVAENVILFGQALEISCNEEAVVWASHVGEYNTNIYRSVCTTDFCAVDTIDDDTGGDTPPFVEGDIPTMGEWGLICLFLLFLIFGVQSIKSKDIQFEEA